MVMIHGGDIYSNDVKTDFSVNINPLGVPKEIKEAVIEAVDIIDRYPEFRNKALNKTTADYFGVDEKNVISGNGVSEVIMTVFQAFRPEKLLLPAPTFYGYVHAAVAVGSQIQVVDIMKSGELGEEHFKDGELIDNSGWGKEVLCKLRDFDTESARTMFVIANPNNPTGNLYTREELDEMADICKEKGIYLVIDESFLSFTGKPKEYSAINLIDKFENVIVLRAFTKIFAVPGIRLGCAVACEKTISTMREQLPEWNISVLAQKSGLRCLELRDYVKDSVKLVDEERGYLTHELLELGFKVYDSRVNFILFYSKAPLYKRLLDKQILIRDCSEFTGLREGYYRIGVKKHDENTELIKALKDIIK
ncbi:MAG: aminotransferase class I/II-fold pyridoxal phosphate-dependent enzyme [Lachnospiraceae bacterium]|nr:aminotransferase class I/II-fold pyridoxal phosphate-dependent enzyme [Lachnospiraceae bacterium]